MNLHFHEMVITVPAPFAGVDSVGFSARYREGESLADVPVLIEGDGELLARLQPRLELLGSARRPEGEGQAYVWTSPITLSDQLLIMAWRDHSSARDAITASGNEAHQAMLNLIRPVTFAFLHDCAAIGGLRLRDAIQMSLRAATGEADIELRLSDIVSENGHLLLYRLDD